MQTENGKPITTEIIEQTRDNACQKLVQNVQIQVTSEGISFYQFLHLYHNTVRNLDKFITEMHCIHKQRMVIYLFFLDS